MNRLKKAALVAFIAFIPSQGTRAAQEHLRPAQDPKASFQTFHNQGAEVIFGTALFRDPITNQLVASPYEVGFFGNQFAGANLLLAQDSLGNPQFLDSALAKQFNWKEANLTIGGGLTGVLNGSKLQREFGAAIESGPIKFKVYSNPKAKTTISSAMFKQALQSGRFFIADAKFNHQSGEKGLGLTIGSQHGWQLDVGGVGQTLRKFKKSVYFGKSMKTRRSTYVEGYGGVNVQGKNRSVEAGMAFILPPKQRAPTGSQRKGSNLRPRSALPRRKQFRPNRR